MSARPKKHRDIESEYHNRNKVYDVYLVIYETVLNTRYKVKTCRQRKFISLYINSLHKLNTLIPLMVVI